MKRLLAFLCLVSSAYAAGTVQQSLTQLGTTNTWVLAFRWTGDASSGSVPATTAQLSGCCQGYLFTQVETVPGSPAPTSGYSVQIQDAGGVDVLNGAAASLSASSPQSFAAASSATPVQGTFSLVISGQSVAGAKGTVFVFISKPGTINLAAISGGGGGNSSANWLTIANPPFVDARRYNFTPQSPGGTLSAGACSFSMNPVPSGVVIGDMLYIAGTGTPEQVPVTNVVGSTVTATCGGAHGAGFTVSSNSAGINEAINVAAATGGMVFLPAGTTTTGTINLPNGQAVMVQGQGINSTTLQLRASTNADLLTNYNFASLTGGGTFPAGIYRVTISDVTLDGNMASQGGTSWCFRVYGHGYTLRNFVAQNCLSGGMYSEYALDPPLNTTTTDLETYWTDIRVKLTGTAADGILFRGPHDSYMDHIVTDEIGGRCFAAETNGTTYNGNTHLSNYDGYNCSLSATVPACSFVGVAVAGTAVTCSASTAGSHGLYLDGAQSVNLTAGNFSALGAGAIGLVIGTTNGSSGNYIQGIFGSASTAAGSYSVQFGLASNNIIDGVFNCAANGPGCINITANDQGAETIRGTSGTNAPLLVGTPPVSSDSISIWSTVTTNKGPTYFVQTPQTPTFRKYHVAKIANGVSGCANANGCWQTNGGTPVNALAALNQSITLETLPVSACVTRGRLVTATAFTGTATAVGNVGNAGGTGFYYSGSYDLKAAVSATNFADFNTSACSNTTSAQNLQLTITTTVSNVDQIATGSAVDVWVQWAPLQ